MLRTAFRCWLLALCLVAGGSLSAQDTHEESYLKDPSTFFWLNTYGNIRLHGRFFWIAQTHFRFRESAERPFAGQLAQLYNRHALSYQVNSHFNVSLGGVMRLNYNPAEAGESNERPMVPEWRIWHEYLWRQPFFNGKIYHRLRLEHRWTQAYAEDADWDYRNRWRFMIAVKHPLNRKHLEPGAFYIGPEAEVILQSGKTVVDSPLEDLRLHGSLGYIASNRLTFATGLMYSMGQDLSDGSVYKQKLTLRTHVYFTPDWRRRGDKLPAIHLRE